MISSLGSEQHHRVVTHRVADRTQGTRNRILQVLKVKPQGGKSQIFVIAFLFFETGFFCIALAALELCWSGWPHTQRSTCLCLPSAEIKGMRHHCPAQKQFLLTGTTKYPWTPKYPCQAGLRPHVRQNPSRLQEMPMVGETVKNTRKYAQYTQL